MFNMLNINLILTNVCSYICWILINVKMCNINLILTNVCSCHWFLIYFNRNLNYFFTYFIKHTLYYKTQIFYYSDNRAQISFLNRLRGWESFSVSIYMLKSLALSFLICFLFSFSSISALTFRSKMLTCCNNSIHSS